MTIPVNKALKKDQFFFVFDLQNIPVAKGESLEYFFELYDNDGINGSKKTRSRLFELRMPTNEDLKDFQAGIQYDFVPFKALYALIKTTLFAFIIAAISSFHGFYTEGGALEVGKSSTKAVVSSSVVIIVCNYLLTQLLLRS